MAYGLNDDFQELQKELDRTKKRRGQFWDLLVQLKELLNVKHTTALPVAVKHLKAVNREQATDLGQKRQVLKKQAKTIQDLETALAKEKNEHKATLDHFKAVNEERSRFRELSEEQRTVIEDAQPYLRVLVGTASLLKERHLLNEEENGQQVFKAVKILLEAHSDLQAKCNQFLNTQSAIREAIGANLAHNLVEAARQFKKTSDDRYTEIIRLKNQLSLAGGSLREILVELGYDENQNVVEAVKAFAKGNRQTVERNQLLEREHKAIDQGLKRLRSLIGLEDKDDIFEELTRVRDLLGSQEGQPLLDAALEMDRKAARVTGLEVQVEELTQRLEQARLANLQVEPSDPVKIEHLREELRLQGHELVEVRKRLADQESIHPAVYQALRELLSLLDAHRDGAVAWNKVLEQAQVVKNIENPEHDK